MSWRGWRERSGTGVTFVDFVDKQTEKKMPKREEEMGQRLTNMGTPQASRKTSEVAAWHVEGGWTLSQSLTSAKAPDPRERQEGGRDHGSWDMRHLSRNQNTRAGQVLGEQGLLMSESQVRL